MRKGFNKEQKEYLGRREKDSESNDMIIQQETRRKRRKERDEH
jgi:hypothetical protein